jgi:flagellar basal body-associated protein FliL
MILFLILILIIGIFMMIVVGLFMNRGQSERQHLEMLKSVNPEAAKKLLTEEARRSRIGAIIVLIGVGFFILWFTWPKGSEESRPKENKAEVISKTYSSDGTLTTETLSTPVPSDSQPAIIYKEWASPGATPKTIIIPQPNTSVSPTVIYREYSPSH